MTRHANEQLLTHCVDPKRLAFGQWDQQHDRMVGEGDIAKAYCADTIGLEDRVKNPFRYQGQSWVCTNTQSNPLSATGHRLVLQAHFKEAVYTYGQKTRMPLNQARGANGFYHAMRVQYGRKDYVLCGPPERFVPGKTAQPGLFDQATP